MVDREFVGQDGSNLPGQRGDDRRPAGPLRWFIALTSALLAFTAVGSALGQLSEQRWWMLSGAAALTLGVPIASTLWLRQLAGGARPTPRLTTLIALGNVLILLVLVGLAGERTASALRQRGDWWVAAVADALALPPDSALRRGSRRSARALADVIAPAPTDRGRLQPHRSRRAQRDPDAPSAAEASEQPAVDPRGRLAAGGEPADHEARGEAIAPSDGPRPSGQDRPLGRARIDFEHHGRAIVVPVTLYGPRLQRDVRMLFDTGATLSTIDSRTLADLGLYVTSGDPTIDLQTANGTARRIITVIEGAAIDGARVMGGLTVALCDACGGSELVGLLGLNFARHFRVTVDHSAGELQLEPKTPPPDRLYDIRPFVRLTDIKGIQRGELLSISLWLENRSPRPLRDVKLLAQSGGASPAQLTHEVAEVEPGRVRLQMKGHVPQAADGFRVEVQRASW